MHWQGRPFRAIHFRAPVALAPGSYLIDVARVANAHRQGPGRRDGFRA
jgi:hypothetical protein